MAKLVINQEVSKEAYELAQGLVKFVGAVKAALKDGWQLGSDMPVVVAAAFSELVPAINGATEIPAEYKEDPAAFVNAFVASSGDLVKVFRS